MNQRQFFIVAGGTCQVYLGDQVVRTLQEGDYFGEIGLVSDKPPSATVKVTANGDCFCLLIPREDFKALFTTEPGVLAEFSIKFLGRKVTLDHVLNHEKARISFLKYCEKEFAKENVEFWKAVEDFESLGKRRTRKSVIRALKISVRSVKETKQQILKDAATRIIQKWVVDQAQDEVSMEAGAKAKILERFKNDDFSYDMFSEAKALVFTIMEGDNFKRYKDSEEFSRLLKEIGEYETLDKDV